MITIHNLAVGQADCILVHFEKEGKYFNLLIDGAYKENGVKNLLDGVLDGKKIQGIVISHLDSDHISGIIDLMKNGYDQISSAFLLFNKFDSGLISYRQANTLTKVFEKNYPSNKLIKSYGEFYTKELMEQLNEKGEEDILPIRIYSLEQRKMSEQIDQGQVNITILGPTIEYVKRFMRKWGEVDNKKKGKSDSEIINRSSIMLLLEFDGKKAILSGDGYYTDIKEALAEIQDLKKICVAKAAHHGAIDNNNGLVELIRKYDIGHVFFTIDEDKYYKGKKTHPSLELLKSLKETDVIITCSNQLDISGNRVGLPADEQLCNYMKQQEKIEVEE